MKTFAFKLSGKIYRYEAFLFIDAYEMLVQEIGDIDEAEEAIYIGE